MSERSPEAVATMQVSDLTVRLASRPIDIVSGVALALDAGEVLGLVGESGSGKTTLALALLGYARAGTVIAGGAVDVDGHDLLSLPAAELRRQRGRLVSYVPQDPASSLDPAMRIGEQLLETLEEHGYGDDASARRLRVAEVLEDTRLPTDAAFLRRYPHQLSGGQQQRVGLAMAFACRPRVVVLDEPTTGLDVTTQAHVLRTVRRLCEEHRTSAVYVSHDLAVVAELAQRIAVMYAGRIVELAPSAALVRDAAHPYTRGLVRAIPDPRLRRELAGIPGRVAPVGRRPTGCGFADRCEHVEPACRSGEIALDVVAVGHEARCRRSELVRTLPSPLTLASGEASAAPQAAVEGRYLAVRELTARYGASEVLHGVDLTVRRGECVALVGESGSGKTTFARCISGLHADASGTIALADTDVPFGAAARQPALRRTIQYVFQNPYSSLNPRKTVAQLLEQPLVVFDGRAPDRDAVRTLLEQVSLDAAYASRYPAQLSGGERQRVAIARALAAQPELLVCDEVTASLDVSVQASILRLLGRLQQERELTLVFVTHNLGVVRGIADTVAVLDGGRIVEHGPAGRVLDDPQDEYTRRLLQDTPSLVA